MVDYRKLVLSLVIAVLFAVFVFSTIDVFIDDINYDDCSRPIKLNDSEIAERHIDENIECYAAKDAIRDEQNFIRFIISSLAGLIVIFISVYISVKTPVGMAVSSGLLLGGLFSIFVGTMSSWGGIGEKVRPFVILIELILVIWLAYKKLNK